MNPIAQSVFWGMIDYAGLFPPASLPMDQAFSRFLEHRRSKFSWMLARFVCPAARLEDLETALPDIYDVREPVRLAVLGRGGDSLDNFLEGIDRDNEAIHGFRSRQGDNFTTEVFEVRLPEAGGVATAVESAWSRLTENGSIPLTPYFEVSLLDEWQPRLPAAAAAVRDTNRSSGPVHRVGLKIRCGGTEAAAIPESEAVAAAIATCRATEISLKATQGLHHPFRRLDPDLDAMTHGFVNLFAASILARVHDLPFTELTRIVSETDHSVFVFEPERLGWRDIEASTEEAAAARKSLLTSFGSCSFSEPINDLIQLGLI